MTKALRQSKIRELIAGKTVRSHEELLSLLEKEGLHATQATLSRDLREIGALKGAEGYSLGQNGASASHVAEEFPRIVKMFLTGAESAGNIALLKTAPGNAHSLGVAIDRAKLEGVLGTIAGDDTIFAVTHSPSRAKRLVRELLSWVEGS